MFKSAALFIHTVSAKINDDIYANALTQNDPYSRRLKFILSQCMHSASSQFVTILRRTYARDDYKTYAFVSLHAYKFNIQF